MARKASDVIGLKVISLDKGEEVGEINDIIYDPVSQRIKAFLLDEGGWFSEAKVIPFEGIEKIGEDAATINSSQKIEKASDVPDPYSSVSERNSKIRKMNVVSENGNNIGKVSDVIFDEQSGEVIEYEITKGPIEDLKTGRNKISKEDISRVGQDDIIVKSEAEEKLKK
ncbi:hypothetical protein C4578_00355 [Candidatus Microgenomates bacterium]|jgi:uncharacterized protein YrrD|nr:MAG: hypothetical protein C4578_00355 [Candidatus Microgenomates bacterium]